MDASGGTPHALRGQHFYGVTPAYAPDGRFIVYGRWLSHTESRDDRFGQDLVVAGSDGADPRVIVSHTDKLMFPRSPSWSLDGRWITYENFGLSNDPIGHYIVAARGGVARTIRTAELALWSPTHADIAAETKTGIAWTRAGRPKPELVIPGGRFPVWSPQRPEFAYSSQQRLYVFDTKTRRSRLVAQTGCDGASDGVTCRAAWSPDGKWLTYFTGPSPRLASNLLIVARDGTRRTLLVGSVLHGGSPSWR